MRLYHFTAVEYISSILEEGLTRGEVPLGPRRIGNAVWLTRNDDPDAQGWCVEGEHILTDEERALHGSLLGRPIPAGARFPNKRAVRLTVDVPDGDGNLKQWLRYAKMRGANQRWLRSLRSSPDWFVYVGVVPPEWIAKVERRGDDPMALIR